MNFDLIYNSYTVPSLQDTESIKFIEDCLHEPELNLDLYDWDSLQNRLTDLSQIENTYKNHSLDELKYRLGTKTLEYKQLILVFIKKLNNLSQKFDLNILHSKKKNFELSDEELKEKCLKLKNSFECSPFLKGNHFDLLEEMKIAFYNNWSLNTHSDILNLFLKHLPPAHLFKFSMINKVSATLLSNISQCLLLKLKKAEIEKLSLHLLGCSTKQQAIEFIINFHLTTANLEAFVNQVTNEDLQQLANGNCHLKELYFNSDKVSILPENFFNLEILECKCPNILFLPDSYTFLKKLDISCKNLRSIPKTYKQLKKLNLQYIDDIEGIPSYPFLEEISLYFVNTLTNFVKMSDSYPSLELLNLVSSQIQKLPESEKLKKLYINETAIASKQILKNYIHLEKLHLEQLTIDPIVAIDELPDTLISLKYLVIENSQGKNIKIHETYTKLKSLYGEGIDPNVPLENFSSLEFLFLQDLDELPNKCADTLRWLWLKDFKGKKLPPVFPFLARLSLLDCHIKKLPYCPELIELEVQDCVNLNKKYITSFLENYSDEIDYSDTVSFESSYFI